MFKSLTLFALFIHFLSNGQRDCGLYVEGYIPINLDEAIEYFECKTSKEALDQLRDKSEEDAIAEMHFSTGMSIRNNWNLWAGTSEIAKYFHDLGIYHPDDMSSIILMSLHRKINGREIELKEQVQYYQDYWSEAEKKEIERKKEEFSEYKIGDKVEFTYNYDFISQRQEKKWMDDKCYAAGVIQDLNRETLELKVRLINSCDPKGIIVLQYDVYDTINGSLQKIESNKKDIMKKGETRWTFYSLWNIID